MRGWNDHWARRIHGPHAATIVQTKPGPRGLPQPPPHAATIAQTKPGPHGLPQPPPHAATIIQTKQGPRGLPQRPPHAATLASVARTAIQAMNAPAVDETTRRRRDAYARGYGEGYKDGFRRGMADGLGELIADVVITQQNAAVIKATHPIEVKAYPGWNGDFDATLRSNDNHDAGRTMGHGAGFDDGYEIALSVYGYARKYAAIPQANKQVALQDNGGTCVYCNAHASEDVDHVFPLKQHWKTRGSVKDQATRSNEANHVKNLVGACAACNRSKGSKLLHGGWWPPSWGNNWWPHGPTRVSNYPPAYWVGNW